MSERDVTLRLSPDEALVLFELASRFTEENVLSIAHGGERAALWRLCASLERVLIAPLEQGYREQLGAARERLAVGAGLSTGDPEP